MELLVQVHHIATPNEVVATVEVISVFTVKGFSSDMSKANSSPRRTNIITENSDPKGTLRNSQPL